jgi:hypothetical protein
MVLPWLDGKDAQNPYQNGEEQSCFDAMEPYLKERLWLEKAVQQVEGPHRRAYRNKFAGNCVLQRQAVEETQRLCDN